MASTLLATTVKSAAGLDSRVGRMTEALPPALTNVSSLERWLSLMVGTYLLTRGATSEGSRLLPLAAGGFLLYRAATGNCPAYQCLGVSTSDSTAPNAAIAGGHGSRVDCSIIVMKPVTEVYRFWRDFENFPNFMAHIVDVDTTTDNRSRWTAEGPLGLKLEWDAEIVTDIPNRVISWRSMPGSDVDTAGSVHFETLGRGRGTAVTVELKYDPPAGKVGSLIAGLLGKSPKKQVNEDLRRFKQLLETGQITR